MEQILHCFNLAPATALVGAFFILQSWLKRLKKTKLNPLIIMVIHGMVLQFVVNHVELNLKKQAMDIMNL
jgi:hypothetical protein